MPNDDITHPIPDLTGYITEGQIVLDRNLNGTVHLPTDQCLAITFSSEKMELRRIHKRRSSDLANQLFSAYAKVGEARNLASVIGEDELSSIDKNIWNSEAFEERYIGRGRKKIVP